MKLTDVDNKLSEGLGDWLDNTIAKTGIRGQAEKLSAQQQDSQRRIYDTGFKYFKNELSRALKSGVESGFIDTTKQQSAQPNQSQQSTQSTQTDSDTDGTVPPIQVARGRRIVIPKSGIPQYYKSDKGKWFNANGSPITGQPQIQSLENMADGGNAREENVPQTAPSAPTRGKKNQTRESNGRFELLGQLLEHRILNEQDTVSGFIQDFVANQTDGFANNPKYQDFIKRVADNAEAEWSKNGSLDDKTYEKLWSTIFNWAKISKSSGGTSSRSSGGSSRSSGVGEVELGGDSDNNGVDDKIDRQQWMDTIVTDLGNMSLNEPSQKVRNLKKMKEVAKQLNDFVLSSSKQ